MSIVLFLQFHFINQKTFSRNRDRMTLRLTGSGWTTNTCFWPKAGERVLSRRNFFFNSAHPEGTAAHLRSPSLLLSGSFGSLRPTVLFDAKAIDLPLRANGHNPGQCRRRDELVAGVANCGSNLGIAQALLRKSTAIEPLIHLAPPRQRR